MEKQTWNRWTEVSDAERRALVFENEFWTTLNSAQQQSFLDDADWQELRHVPAARELKLGQLVSLQEICTHLQLSDVEVYWLMSTRKLPGWLVDGTWKFDRLQVDRWVEGMGGNAAVQQDVKAQIAEHRAGR